MSAHVLLNLLNELGKIDKMRGLSSILSLFRNEFDKFNNTRARMLDSIYHMTLRLFWNLIFAIKRYNFVFYIIIVGSSEYTLSESEPENVVLNCPSFRLAFLGRFILWIAIGPA